MQVKKIISVLLLVTTTLLFTGCDSDVQWLKSDEVINYVSGDELTINTYYVKQGTKFYPTLTPKSGSGLNNASYVNKARVLAISTEDDDCNVPSHYKDEVLAFTSNKEYIGASTIERYYDLGYSIGLYNGVREKSDGFILFNKKNLVKGSDFSTQNDSKANDIRIASINGEPISDSMFDKESGVIVGLEKNATYKIGYYLGTYYHEDDIVADTLMLKSFEIFNYDASYTNLTQNGYMCFNTPNDLKSGYYYINSSGLFRYYDHERGADDNVNMNEKYYSDDIEMLMAMSQQFSANINTKSKDVEFIATFSLPFDYYTTSEDEYVDVFSADYDESDVTSSSFASLDAYVKGVITSPDGTIYEMTLNEEESTLNLNLSTAEPGKWLINIIPREASVEVTVNSSEYEEEASLIEKEAVFTETDTNVLFKVDVVGGKETIHGYITDEKGNAYDMVFEENRDYDEFDKNSVYGSLVYTMPFIEPGTYNVKIYYHPEICNISDLFTGKNTETNTDVIHIGD